MIDVKFTPEWVSAIATSAGLLIALGTAAWTILETVRARDFSTIEAIRRATQEASIILYEKLQDENLTDAAYDFYAQHFLDVLEFAAHATNHNMVARKGRSFLADWLEGEMMAIKNSVSLKRLIQAGSLLGGPEYKELRAFCKVRSIQFHDL